MSSSVIKRNKFNVTDSANNNPRCVHTVAFFARRKRGTFLSVATLWYRIFGNVPRQRGDSCARHPAVQGLVIGTETIGNRCEAAPSNAASLIVAHGTLGKAILL